MPIFDDHINQVITDKKDLTKSDKCKISTSVLMKDILSGNQHCFPIQHMAKNISIYLQNMISISFGFPLCLGLQISIVAHLNIKLLNQYIMILLVKPSSLSERRYLNLTSISLVTDALQKHKEIDAYND